MLDAVTDIYIISMYYNTEGLQGQASAMLAMIATNMGLQIVCVLTQYKKKSWKVKVKEVLICLFFLRPAVDAYRVSTNYKDNEVTADPLAEMITNKVRNRGESFEHQNIGADTQDLPHFDLCFASQFDSYRRQSSLHVSRYLVACCRSSS